MPYQYSLQLDGDALPLGTRRPPLYESVCLQIRIRRRAYIEDSVVQELPEYAQAFTLLHEMLLHEDSARIFLSICLSAMGIPIHDQGQMINAIASFYLDMGVDPTSSTCSGGAIPIVLADILIEIHDETQAVNRAIEESMDLAMFKAVPATKSSIEGLKKVRLEGSGSMEDDMFEKVLCRARSYLHVVLARLSWRLHCSVA
ncbi:unnamed protein product [Ilex paraguariensis]|uniref:Uncharacterized protein n=1 Tax=Ilex paraguariensis TaxID=185542 RepID=A0ABC8UQR4_9AQUA